MISELKQIEDLFKEIDNGLTKKVKVYIIGDAVLLFQGLKPATKDIDIILEKKDEITSFEKALISIKFKTVTPTAEYKNMELDKIFVREDYRIDVYLKRVCKKFSLSNDMIKRSIKIQYLKNIYIHHCSNEDIFLFKCLTERPGDLDDCKELAKKGLKWDIIKDEMINQINKIGQDVWITRIGERLHILQDMGITIPIMKDIDKLSDDYYKKLEKEQKKKN